MCKNLGESGVGVVPVRDCVRGVGVLEECVERDVGYDEIGSLRDRGIENSKRGGICLLCPLVVLVRVGLLLGRTLYRCRGYYLLYCHWCLSCCRGSEGGHG